MFCNKYSSAVGQQKELNAISTAVIQEMAQIKVKAV